MKSPGKTRIALYSPGVVGLGHLRRNLLISQALAESELQSVNLMVTEAREASAFMNSMPSGVDCLTLPGLSRGVDGLCKPRYLNLPLKEVTTLRGRIIRAALKSFAPDLLIVDHLPRGAYRELDPALRKLKAMGHTHCVLGLRDVLDDPWTVHRDWFRWRFDEAIDKYFDAIWVYGDPAVYNMVEEYRFPPSIASKIRFAGYLDQRKRLTSSCPNPDELISDGDLPDGRMILCLLGGGQDGDRLAEAFSQAEFPADTWGLIVTGPFMSEPMKSRLLERVATNPRLRVLNFISEPTRLVERADRIIAMGGYNTVCEVLSFEKRALIVPRVKPRREQIIRAERLREMGMIDMLEIEHLTTRALEAWMAKDVPRPRVHGTLKMDGLEQLPGMAAEVLGLAPAEAPALEVVDVIPQLALT